ncbi:MAG: hypothetical protein ACKO2X_06030, partial [Bacteroidota bacterium]
MTWGWMELPQQAPLLAEGLAVVFQAAQLGHGALRLLWGVGPEAGEKVLEKPHGIQSRDFRGFRPWAVTLFRRRRPAHRDEQPPAPLPVLPGPGVRAGPVALRPS